MKKIFLLCCMLMITAFGLKAQTLLNESFDSGTLPTGWTVIDNDGDGYNWDAAYPVSGSFTTFSGAGCIASASYINSVGALTPDNWLISPAVTLTGDAILTFSVAGQDESDYEENYTVYISTTGTSITDFSILMTGTTTEVFETKNINLSNYTGETVYIAFRHHNTSDMYWLKLDEVSITPAPTDPIIDVAPTTLTFGTTMLGDTSFANLNITSYNLTSDISVTSAAPFEISSDGVNYDYSVTLASTDIVLYVRYIPTAGGTDNGVISFTSGSASTDVTVIGTCMDCNNITLPLTQSFESAADLSCWSVLSANTVNPLAIVTGISTQGNASFRFNSYSSASDYTQYLITPELPVTTNNKMVSFDYAGYTSGTESFMVGYSTTTNDPTVFTWGTTISVTGQTWHNYIQANIPADAKFIGIKYVSNYAYYMYVDNMSIDEVSDCMAPNAVTASHVNQNSAQINWNPLGTEEAWTVAVVEQGDDPDNATSEYVTAHPYTVENLMPNTAYEVYVKAECETGSSSWSAAGSFTTTPDCSNPSNPQVTDILGTSAVLSWTAAPYGVTSYTVEYGEAESGSTDQVFVDNATTVILTGLNPQTEYEFTITSECNSETLTPTPVAGTFTTGCLVGGDVVIGDGTESTYYYPSNSCYNYSTSEQIFTAAEMGNANTLHSVSFDCYSPASPSTRNLTIYLMHTTQISANGWLTMTGAEQVYSGNYTFTAGWNTINFDTTFAYNGTDNLAIIIDDNTGSYSCSNYFNGHVNSNGYSAYYYSDGTNVNPMSPSNTPYTNSVRANIKFGGECDETTTCVSPVITDFTYTSDEATITWVAGYQENSWNLQYKSADDTAWTDEGSVTSPYTISNLMPDKEYEIRLYSDCGGDEMSSPVDETFRTECATIIPPYTETFTGWDNTPSVCWSRYNNMASSVFGGTALTESTSGWYFSSSNVFPVGHPKVNVYGTGCNYWLVTPSIDLTDMVNPELTFELALTDYGNEDPIEDPTAQQDDKFMVIVSTDNGLTWSQANATVWDNEGSARVYNSISYQGEEISISLAQYIGQTIKIAFYGESTASGGDNDLHIANVHVGERPACAKPQVITITNATASSFEFSWIPAGDESAWEYFYVPQGTTVDFDTVQWVSAYDTFAVVTDLNANTLYTIYVRANCDNGEQSEPKTLDARTACGQVTIPFYEGFESFASGASAVIHCWTRSNDYSTSTNYPYINTYAATGTKGLYFYGSTGTYNLIATPEIDSTIDLNTLQVSFSMNVDNVNSALVVGAMTDPNDLSTFVGIDTVRNTATSVWNFSEVSLASYTGTGSYVAFKYLPASSYTSIYVDDIRIEEIPSCPRPTHLTAQSTSSDTVILSWTDAAGDLWDVIYGPAGFDPLTSTDAITISGITTTTYSVDGLTAGVTYDFYVRRDCGNGDVSPWSTVPAVGSPYLVMMGTTGSGSVTGCGFTVVDDGGINGNYSNDCDYTLTIYPSDPNSLVSVFGTLHAEGTADYLSIYDGTTADESNLIQKVTASSTTVTVGPFTSESGPMTLKFHSDYSVVYGGFVLNVNCESIASCRKPVHFASSGNTNTSASLVWSELGSATAWNVAYGATGFDPDETVNIESVLDTTAVISDLTAGTSYDFYVQSDCGGETSEWVGPVTVIPGSFNMPVTGNATITMCGGTIYDNGGANGDYANNCDAHLTVNPETPNDLVTISGTLNAESATFDYLIIYDGDGTTELYHSNQSGGGSAITFGPIESTTGPLVVYFHSDVSTTFAGFALNVTCTPAPTCRKPHNFTVLGTTTTEAILSWTELGTANSWNVEYGPAGFTQGNGIMDIATSNPFTVTGLTEATAYDFYIQANCDGGETSEWSDVASATTDCNVVSTFPFTENFDASATLPDCWTNANVTGSTNWQVSTPSHGAVYSAHSGSSAATFYQGGSGNAADLQMPTLDLTSLTNPVLTFWYTNESWSGDIDQLTVYYRSSVTDAWTPMAIHATGTDVWTFDSLALPTPSATYQIKFHASSSYGYGINIDDVTVMDANATPVTPCDAPTALAATNVAQTSATINWQAGGSETAWNLQYKAASAANWSNSITVNNTPTYNLTGLTANTAYQVRVQAACSASETSDWTTASFTTLAEEQEECPAPTNFRTEEITKNSVTLAWNQAAGTATEWEINYKTEAAATWTNITVTTNPYTITDLTPETAYQAQIIAHCTNGVNSDASEIITFTTLPDGINNYVLDNSTSLYPNPTTGLFTISNEQCAMNTVNVYDVYGKLLMSVEVNGNVATIDATSLSAGVYFAKVETEKGVVTKRFVKK